MLCPLFAKTKFESWKAVYCTLYWTDLALCKTINIDIPTNAKSKFVFWNAQFEWKSAAINQLICKNKTNGSHTCRAQKFYFIFTISTKWHSVKVVLNI